MNLYRNRVLKHLSPEVIRRLQLKPVTLDVGRQLETHGERISRLYFIESGMGSMTTVFRNGFTIEVGLFGRESVIGVSGLMGTKSSLNNIYMQLPGHGFTCTLDLARREFHRGEDFQELTLRYVQAQLMQATQSAACNAKHELIQRLPRWLLLCAERLDSKEINVTHELLGMMLGVKRSTVTVAAQSLHDRGLIDYRRGKIRIIDRTGLEAAACECYGVVKEQLETYQMVAPGAAA